MLDALYNRSSFRTQRRNNDEILHSYRLDSVLHVDGVSNKIDGGKLFRLAVCGSREGGYD